MTASPLSLASLLTEMADVPSRHLEVLALLTLGILDAIESEVLTPDAARHQFFTGENCLFVRETLRSAEADSIMSRGVELPDLFEALSHDVATRESHKEIAAMRAACLRLLGNERLVA